MSGDVENDQTDINSFEVASRDPVETFLSCCVPDMQFKFRALNVDIFPDEIDSHCCLNLRFKISPVEL